MRTNAFLHQRLKSIWATYFSDMPMLNNVVIMFGPRAKKRLGSIRKVYHNDNDKYDTQILINGHFKDPEIPQDVIDATIAHELVHYSHGFSSPLPKLSRFPHKGDVVDKDMEKRGLGDLMVSEYIWLDNNWIDYLKRS